METPLVARVPTFVPSKRKIWYDEPKKVNAMDCAVVSLECKLVLEEIHKRLKHVEKELLEFIEPELNEIKTRLDNLLELTKTD